MNNDKLIIAKQGELLVKFKDLVRFLTTDYLEYSDKQSDIIEDSLRGSISRLESELTQLQETKEEIKSTPVSRVTVQCRYCLRKFIRKMPHKCKGGYRKHGFAWLELVPQSKH